MEAEDFASDEFEDTGEEIGVSAGDSEEQSVEVSAPDRNEVKVLCEQACVGNGAWGLYECAEDSRQHSSCYEECVVRGEAVPDNCQNIFEARVDCCEGEGGVCGAGEPEAGQAFCGAVCPDLSAEIDACI